MKTQIQVSRSWAAITIKKWRANIKSLKIGDSLELERSFKAFVQTESGGDVSKVRLLYNYYGKFVDMGVGKGVKNGGQRDNSTAKKLAGKRGKSRVSKKWYSKTMATEAFILGQIMQDYYGGRATAAVSESLAGKVEMNF